MKLEQASYSVDKVVNFNDEYLKHVQFNQETTHLSENIIGGILSDIRYSWMARGPKLQILHTKSGSKVAAWCFRAQHDFYTAVTCVVDLVSGNGKAPLLVVGLECEITGGMICVFDVGSSRVVRAVQIDDKVTSIEVVNGGRDSSLPGILRALDGLIAVGTAKGKVLLVDLCRQICEEAIGNSAESIKDEINSCHLIQLSFDDLKILETHKEMSLSNGDHLCLQLNENSTDSEHFSLYGPSGEIRLRANMSEVTISCLHFSSALGALLVGYNFGVWQMYNLISSPFPVLSYTSPMYEDCIPVAYFAVQEPCDDPRAFCYVWASYSIQDSNISDSIPATSIAVMYSLTYQSKEYLEGYGILYQDLSQCSVRFQLELGTVFPGKNQGAKCLGLRAYTKPTIDVSDERLAVCTVVWTCWDTASIGGVSEIYLAVFDLNQWYKEQMPAQPRMQNERYMACISLTEVMANNGAQLVSADELLDFRLDPQSLSPFLCPQRLEEHYYPSALAFRALGLFCRQLTWLRSSGSQRHLLSQLELAGPLCLLQPGDLYHRCVALGLCPSYCDLQPSPTAVQQRLFVLNVALEHQLVSWLCRCARDWANGAQAVSECTLDMLLNWGWQRANTLKFAADKLCITLFDHTGEKLDQNALLHLNHSTCQLKHLTTLFETVLSFCQIYFPPQDIEDIRYQFNSLQMISIYLEVMQWLLNVGLLPECPLSMYPLPDEAERISAPYPVENLARFYVDRRAELSDEGTSLLFIDQLVQKEFEGGMLSKQWECDGGNGLYPPPSLQALLRTYLVENIDITHKHCLFIYVFLDLAMTLDQSRYKSIITHLIKFPAVFKLSPSIIKMTQAFWQLDHGDFSTAMSQLLDPAVNSEDLKPWHHRTVLKALLLQGQHQHALLYHQVRKPPVSSIQDICIVITLLIVNDLLQEAFHFQRENKSVYNEKEILKHFFSVSEKMNQLPNILHLPLSVSEEEILVSYLKNISCETNDTYLVIYYLLRNRYNEAFTVNDDLNVILTQHGVKQGLLGQQDRNFRNVMVSGFKKTLPNVTQLLLDIVKKDMKQKGSWKMVERPQPMSVFIHDTQEKAKYKSSLIEASLQKVKEIWAQVDGDTPFISTPRTPNGKPNESVLIYANVMQPDVDLSEDLEMISEATPAKRMRLSPRQLIHYKSQRLSGVDSSSLSLLDTPIVKRKSYRGQTDQESNQNLTIGTPTSILKVRSFIRNSISSDVQPENDDRGTSTTPEMLEDQESGITPLSQNISMQSYAVNLLSAQRRQSPLGLSPRRSLQRTPRPAVHFEDATRPNSRSSDGSIETSGNKHLSVRIDVHREQTPELPSSKDSTRSTEDVFYSPNTSFSSSDTKNTNSIIVTTKIGNANEQMDIETDDNIEDNYNEERKVSLKRKASDNSVKSRRSYKNITPIKDEVAKNVHPSSLLFKDSGTSVETPPTSSEDVAFSVPVTTHSAASQGFLTLSRRSTTCAPVNSASSIRSTASKTISVSSRQSLTPSATVPNDISSSGKCKPDVSSSKTILNFPGPLPSSRKSVSASTTKITSPTVVMTSLATLPVQSIPRKSTDSSRTSTNFKESVPSPKISTASSVHSVLPRRSTRSKSMEPSPKTSTISSNSSPKNKNELFPKVVGRRSLSRQVLEHNTITKALQLPKASTRISLAEIPVLENINSQTTSVEVSYSKTVTSIVKKSSDIVTEETCDKSTVELKNIFTNEKGYEDDGQIIKHVHNESCSKSSVKKITEILDKDSSEDTISDYHVLSFTSDIDNSFQSMHEDNNVPLMEENKKEDEQKEELQNKQQEYETQKKDEHQTKIQPRTEQEEIISELNMNVSIEEELNKKSVSNETSFEDISSIIESEETDSTESDPNEEMDISDPISTVKPDLKDIREEKDENITEEEGKNSLAVPEILAADEEDSQHYSESSDNVKPHPEENRSSSEFSEDAYKQPEKIAVEEDSIQSSQFSEVVEKFSDHSGHSSEKLDLASRDEKAVSEEIEDEEINVDEVDEKVENFLVPSDDDTSEDEKISNQESEEEQSEAEEEQSSKSFNSSTSSDIIEINSSSDVSIEAITLNQSEDPEENLSEGEDNILEQNITTVEEVIEDDVQMQQAEEHEDNKIENIGMEMTTNDVQKVCEDMQQVEEELQQMEEEIQKMEEIRAIAMEQDAVESAAELALVQEMQESQQNIVPEIVQQERDQVEQGMEEKSEQDVAQEITQEIVKTSNIIEEEEKSKTINEAIIEGNISQDCLETIKLPQSQLREDLEQTDILCNDSFAKETKVEPLIQKEEIYTPSRRSIRINSKQQETKDPLEDVIVRKTRRRSMSIDLEKSPSKEIPKSVGRPRKQNIDIKSAKSATSLRSTSSVSTEETLKPIRSSARQRSNSVSSEIVQEEETLKPVRSSTRRRSTSTVSTEELAPRATRGTRSASIDAEESKPSIRKRSTSIDAEEMKSIARTPRRTRKINKEEEIKEDLSRRSTRASSVINLPVIAEEGNIRRTQASSVSSENSSSKSPARRGRKRSIQSEPIDEELETISDKIEEYSATHRLTRRQKMIMEKSLEIQERKKLEVIEFDPIKLLDKKDFTGSPDLEERHYRGNSPTSSIDTQSSAATRITPEGTPKKTTRRRISQTTPGTPRRSSRHSRDALDEVSSVRSVPVIQLDRGDIQRYRSLSPTALKDSAPSPSTRKSVRSSVLPKKIDLSKISEENDTKSSQESTAQEKGKRGRGRPKKSDNTNAEESQSNDSVTSKASSSRRRTYKPLEEYVPRYSAYKTRKSFKLKKLTRSGAQ